MSTAIDLRVNTSQINIARKAVADLSQQMSGLDNSDLTLGGDSLARDANLLRQASLDITRLGSLARSGEAKGGILDTKQWADAAGLSKRIGDNLGGWLQHTRSLKGELSIITRDLKELDKDWLSAGTARKKADIEQQQNLLRESKSIIEKELKGRGNGDGRAEDLRRRSEEYGASIEGYGSPSGNISGGIGKGISKVAGYGAALLGGLSALNLLSQALSNANTLYPSLSRLQVMGVDTGLEKYAKQRAIAEKLGYSDIEMSDMALASMKASGKTRPTMSAMMLERGFNVSSGTTLAYAGATQQMSRGSDSGIMLNALQGMAKASGNLYRLEEVISHNQSLMTQIFMSTGGRDFSDSDKKRLAGMQGSALQNISGSMPYNDALLSKAHSGIAGNGADIGADLLKFYALGGTGIENMDDVWNYKLRVENGINDKRNLPAIMAMIKKLPGRTDAKGKLNGYGKSELQKQSPRMKANDIEAFLRDPSLQTEGGGSAYANAHPGNIGDGANQWGRTEGAQYTQTAAGLTNATTEWGKLLQEELVLKMKRGMIAANKFIKKGDFLGAFSEFSKDNPLGLMMGVGFGNQIGGPYGAAAAGAAMWAGGKNTKGKESALDVYNTNLNSQNGNGVSVNDATGAAKAAAINAEPVGSMLLSFGSLIKALGELTTAITNPNRGVNLGTPRIDNPKVE